MGGVEVELGREGGVAWWIEKNTNATSGEITDIWLGGLPAYGGGYYWNSFGRMSQIHWFDRLLTHDEMVGMTTCGGKQLRGNLIDWETTPLEFEWEQDYDIQEVWVQRYKAKDSKQTWWETKLLFWSIFYHGAGRCFMTKGDSIPVKLV